jgi:hypothetical protein
VEMCKLEYLTESKLHIYKSFSVPENEEHLLMKYLSDFNAKYNKTQSQIAMPIPLTRKIITYDYMKKDFTSLQIPEKNYFFKFFDYSRYLNCDNMLFISGGVDNEREINKCFFYHIDDMNFLEISQMKKQRSQHSLIYYQTLDIIFAVSGFNNTSVEIFNLKTNQWKLFKNLSKPRCNSNALFCDNKFIYVFAGSDGDKYLGNSFERIQIEGLIENYEKYDQTNFEEYEFKFEIGHFSLLEKVNLTYSGFGIIPLDQKQFLVFGGFNIENDYQICDEIRLFDSFTETKVIEQQGKKNAQKVENVKISSFKSYLPASSCFYNQDFLRTNNDNFIAQFNAAGVLVVFNIKNQEFSAINHNLNI